MLLSCALAAAPHAGYVYPAGAARGDTVTVLVGGQGLNRLQGGMVSGEGVTVVEVENVPGFANLDRSQRKYLTDSIRHFSLGEKAPTIPDTTDDWRHHPYYRDFTRLTPLKFSIVKRDMFIPRNALQMAPALRQLAIVTIAVSPNAAPGRRELRLWSADGITAPRPFYVETAKSVQEPFFRANFEPRPALVIHREIPCTFHGQIMPGETDVFNLRLEAGQLYTFAVTAREMLPYIGDAVPGHFQANLSIVDTDGHLLAFADDHYFRPDPVLRFTPRTTDIYKLRIADNLYRGRDDFVYRIEAVKGEIPYDIEFKQFPWLERVAKADYTPTVKGEPIAVEGVIERSGQSDSFMFYARVGSPVVLEIAARVAGSPLDGILRILDRNGTVVAENDDRPTPINVGIVMQSADDPYLCFEPPEDGWYTAVLSDVTGKGGRDYRYLFRIDKPRPDFAVYSYQSGVNFVRDPVASLKFYIVRREGFKGSIKFKLPVFCLLDTPKMVAPDVEEVTLRLRSRSPKGSFLASMSIQAIGGDSEIVREVIPCDTFSQAFAYDHFVPANELYFFARNKYQPPPPPKRQDTSKNQGQKQKSAQGKNATAKK